MTDAASDVAVRMTLNAYEHAVRSNPDRKAERRHRIQNVESVADEDLPRLPPLGILASMRPLDDEAAGNTGAPPLARADRIRSSPAGIREWLACGIAQSTPRVERGARRLQPTPMQKTARGCR